MVSKQLLSQFVLYYNIGNQRDGLKTRAKAQMVLMLRPGHGLIRFIVWNSVTSVCHCFSFNHERRLTKIFLQLLTFEVPF